MKRLFIISICLLTLSGCRYATDASDTVFEQTKLSSSLKKYEYFKDLSAGIDRKRAEIELYQSEISSMTKEGDKDDKFYLQQRKSELLGLISIHNSLCAEYNSAMSKINYSFCNVGSLPDGATTPLPREFKPYINKLN